MLISGVVKEKAWAEQIRMQVPTYVLDLGTNGRVVFLMGEIDHGITKSLEALIDKNPDVTDIVLESRGGNPFEARGVARVIRHHRLDTHVAADCFYSPLSPERRECLVPTDALVSMATD